MKSYQVSVDLQAGKFFCLLPPKQAEQLKMALKRLEANHRPQDSKKLVDTGGYRLTVGEYRILYLIDDEAAMVDVYLIHKRNDFSY
jgi:mRNA-degrading endonuclease RelE of RelBE toxin-antitoxin system